MKAYVSDPEDLKQDPLYQETWDDMVVNVSLFTFLSKFMHFVHNCYEFFFWDLPNQKLS